VVARKRTAHALHGGIVFGCSGKAVTGAFEKKRRAGFLRFGVTGMRRKFEDLRCIERIHPRDRWNVWRILRQVRFDHRWARGRYGNRGDSHRWLSRQIGEYREQCTCKCRRQQHCRVAVGEGVPGGRRRTVPGLLTRHGCLFEGGTKIWPHSDRRRVGPAAPKLTESLCLFDVCARSVRRTVRRTSAAPLVAIERHPHAAHIEALAPKVVSRRGKGQTACGHVRSCRAARLRRGEPYPSNRHTCGEFASQVTAASARSRGG
jgi:hypothetical protein